ncbi:MAG: ABC transporter ATP-binding protein [Pseudomonadota bacterium]
MSAGLAVEGAVKRYAGQTAALGGVDLAVPAGAYAVILGPSGSGKSTLLGALGGFVALDAGRVTIEGRDVTALAPQHRPTATVFQDYALFPHMDLADNVGFGLRMAGTARAARRARAEALLALVGLQGLGARRPAQLSGGQRQRVALARALAPAPQVLLLDEPLGALDVALRRSMQRELKAIQRDVGTTFVHVTHDQEEAMALADLLVVMDAGRIEDQGPPERVYRRPRSRFAARFLGEINLVPASAGPMRDGALTVACALGPLAVPLPSDGAAPAPGTALDIGIRPEAFRAQTGGAALALPVVLVEATFFGTHYRVVAEPRPAGPPIVAHLPPTAEVLPGTRATLSLDPASVVALIP